MNFRGSAGLDFTVLDQNSGQFRCPEPRIPVGGSTAQPARAESKQNGGQPQPKQKGYGILKPILHSPPVVSVEAVAMVKKTLGDMERARLASRKKKKLKKEGRIRVY